MSRNNASILLALGISLGLPACGGEGGNNPVVDNVDQDVDGDHIPNLLDNCPNDPNPDQANNDGDPQGDVCDPDDDNDGVNDPSDNCPMIANLDQADPDRDRLGSACDPDRDGDGVVDYCDFASAPVGCIVNDNCLGVWNPRQVDSDHDGTGDACTRDCDHDGVANFNEGHDETVQDCGELAADFDGDGFRGLNDCREDNPAINIAADEVCNGIDDDCDGVADEGLVNCQPFPLPDGDADGSPDVVDNCPLVRNEDQADRDHDNVGDLCDDDEGPPPECMDDEDCDLGDACNLDHMCVEICGEVLCAVNEMCVGDQCVLRPQPGNDPDEDGVPSRCADEPNPPVGCHNDNCPADSNANQADRDNDGIGDACDGTNDLGCEIPELDCPQNGQICVQLDADEPLECGWPDADSDGVPDRDDSCPQDVNLGTDLDNDGIDDACDPRDDRLCQDGGPNCAANDILVCVDFTCLADQDNDDVPNECPEGVEGCHLDNCPANANADQADNDNDGLGNACDACPNFNGPPNSCGACAPQAQDVCDGLDNDCDGTIDEGFNLGVACNVGVGACARSGNIICNGAGDGTVCSVGPGNPVDEMCDGLDNDCDGTVDEGFNLGAACTNGVGACARAGTLVCAGNGQAMCNAVAGEPGVESCNGLDDDCDGNTDEAPNGQALSRVCYTGPVGTAGVGICHTGTQTCANGEYGACVGEVGPALEVCDGLDNDCDGANNEGLVCVDPNGDDDADGVLNGVDNCPDDWNPEQGDRNGNNIGNACDVADCPLALMTVARADFEYSQSTVDNLDGNGNPRGAWHVRAEGVGELCVRNNEEVLFNATDGVLYSVSDGDPCNINNVVRNNTLFREGFGPADFPAWCSPVCTAFGPDWRCRAPAQQ